MALSSPLSVIPNWMAELSRFLPSVRAVSFTGDKATREQFQSDTNAFVGSQPKSQVSKQLFRPISKTQKETERDTDTDTVTVSVSHMLRHPTERHIVGFDLTAPRPESSV